MTAPLVLYTCHKCGTHTEHPQSSIEDEEGNAATTPNPVSPGYYAFIWCEECWKTLFTGPKKNSET